MKLSFLSAVALSVSVIAAPALAEEVKPVQPTVGTQADPVALGTLTQSQLFALGFTVLTVGAALIGNENSTPDNSTPSTVAE